MSILKKILRIPYRLAVKVAKKITNFDNVFSHSKELEKKIETLDKNVVEANEEMKLFKEEYNWGHPKGHYYSPVHSKEETTNYDFVKKKSKISFTKLIPNFSDKEMVNLYVKLVKYFGDYNFPELENSKSRFFIKNGAYPITDSLVLFSMIRHFKPKRIIEIGSGMTSALMMDINENYFSNKIELTFIEPYPEFLLSRMRTSDKKKYKVIGERVQEVPLKEFSKLNKGDILFIDSTHVSKFNSDVNYEIFDILPILKKGVLIHFHDVFDGFEYPLSWLNLGWAWNEDYLLRAFFSHNKEYKILLMNDYLSSRHNKLLLSSFEKFPNDNGGSLWVEKTANI